MRALWDKHPQPAYDIIKALEKSEEWAPNTVKTLLNRLVKKGALKVTPYKNLFLYSPAVKEADCVRAESKSFVDRFFGGNIRPLLVHFAETKQLTAEDLKELEKILKKGKK